MTVRQFDFGIAAKEQTEKTITGARRGVKKTGPSFVGEIFIVILRIKAR